MVAEGFFQRAKQSPLAVHSMVNVHEKHLITH